MADIVEFYEQRSADEVSLAAMNAAWAKHRDAYEIRRGDWRLARRSFFAGWVAHMHSQGKES
jgi:hypothetical protein